MDENVFFLKEKTKILFFFQKNIKQKLLSLKLQTSFKYFPKISTKMVFFRSPTKIVFLFGKQKYHFCRASFVLRSKTTDKTESFVNSFVFIFVSVFVRLRVTKMVFLLSFCQMLLIKIEKSRKISSRIISPFFIEKDFYFLFI